MLLLSKISMIDLIVVCFITISLILIMGIILLLSSKKNYKKNSKKQIKIQLEEKNISPKNEVNNLIKEDKINEEHKTDIARVLEKMEDELEHGPSKKTPSFEEEQEKKAIISYKELLKVAGKLKEEIKENEEYGEHKVIDEVNFNEIEVEKNEDILENNKNKKFQSSDIISPIYGKQEDETEKNKNEDFLSSLKDFRKNLQ